MLKRFLSALTSAAAGLSMIPFSGLQSFAQDDEMADNEVSFFGYSDEVSEEGLMSQLVDENGNPYYWDISRPNLNMGVDDIPSKYDLRDYGWSTSVKDQGQTGTCWAHASLAAAESNMIKKGLADSDIDLSESHMVWFSRGSVTYDQNDPLCGDGDNNGKQAYLDESDSGLSGGNNNYAQSVLARGSGVQYQSEEPDVTEMPEIDESHRYISHGLLVNSDVIDPVANAADIKRHIMKTGAMEVSYYSSKDKEFLSYTNGECSYLQNQMPAGTTNHAVTIIGWDDNFSRSNFGKAKPAGNGAWLCKNSWGEDWGNDGYFYISYYEPTLHEAASYEIEPVDTYDYIYQLDGSHKQSLGYTGDSDNSFGSTITAGNMFTARADELLTAVGFYNSLPDTPYNIYIYTGCTEGKPTSGKLVYSSYGDGDVMTYAGYHVVNLKEAVKLKSGQRFSVLVNLDRVKSCIGIDNRHSLAKGSGSFYKSGGINSNYIWNKPTEYNVVVKGYANTEREISEETFPDSVFRSYVLKNIDSNGDGILSAKEISAVKVIDVRNMGIEKLDGIEKFTELEELYCGGNKLLSIDVSLNKKLVILNGSNCGRTIESLPCGLYKPDGLDMTRITRIYNSYQKDDSFVIGNNFEYLTYTYDCGNSYSLDFTITVNEVLHDFAEWSYDDWSHWSSCQRDCGAMVYEKHSNTSDEWLYEYHRHYQICEICGGEMNSEAHRMADTWTDVGTSHSKKCEICDREVFGEHICNIWKYTTNETHTGYCLECGTELVKPHGEYGEWKAAGEYHSKVCSECREEIKEPHSCSSWKNSGEYHTGYCDICNEKVTAEHEYGEWTEQDDGNYLVRTCNSCDAEQRWGGPNHTKHELCDWIDLGENGHGRMCYYCDYFEESEHEYENSWTEGKDEHYRICTVCERKSGHKPEFGKWISDGEGGHYRICTNCTIEENEPHGFDASEYEVLDENFHYKACADCGDFLIEEHRFGEWFYDIEPEKYAYCKDCGKMKTEKIIVTMGDIDGDGRISAIDFAVLRIRILFGFDDVESMYPADVNCDGDVNIADLTLMQSFLLEKVTSFKN